MRPTTATDDNVFDFQALLNPGTVFEHPRDVVMHPSLTVAEKRAILASESAHCDQLRERRCRRRLSFFPLCCRYDLRVVAVQSAHRLGISAQAHSGVRLIPLVLPGSVTQMEAR
jgi:hypothetical protein